MIAVSARLADPSDDRPPIVLVHGAANSAAVWTFWMRELAARGWSSYAVDLRGHGASAPIDLSRVSMHDYAADVSRLVEQLGRRPVVIGWSMGGLVALMVAATGRAEACVGLAPSTPARTVDPSVALRTGEFGPDEYGITSRNPEQQRGMRDLDLEERTMVLASLARESRLARDERRRGIVIDRLPCPLLIVTGTADRQWPRERYTDLWLEAEYASVDGASHWGLVLSRRAIRQAAPAVLSWLAGSSGRSGA